MRRAAAPPRPPLMRHPTSSSSSHPAAPAAASAATDPTPLLAAAAPSAPPPAPPLRAPAAPLLLAAAAAVLLLLAAAAAPSIAALSHAAPPDMLWSSSARARGSGPQPTAASAAAANALAVRVFAAAAASARDVLLCPASIARTLALAAAGATPGSPAEAQLRALLGPGPGPGPAAAAALPNTGRDVTLAAASSVWLSGLVEPAYADAARALGAEARGPPSSPAEVNDWVRKATRGAIPAVLDSLPTPLVALLVDAAYFRAPWTTSFDKARSRMREFEGRDGEIMTMRSRQKQEFDFAETSLALAPADGDTRSVKVAQLPYGKAAEFAAVVVLPQEGVPLDEVVAALKRDGAPLWDAWLSKMAKVKLDLLSLPRFKLEFGVKGLKETLQQVRVTAPFILDASNPPLLAMTKDREAFIKDVFHKATIEVSEEGTVASAATVAVVMTRSMPRPGPNMIVDRPFLFAIRHVTSGTILFLGRVDNPVPL